MARIYRSRPPRVQQSLGNSCWAAVLESWSNADPRIPQQQESALIARYGEGPTGGITPGQKIPQLARRFNLQWGGFDGAALDGYLTEHLPNSHVFCAYRTGAFLHAVLVYGYSGSNAHVMDPRGPSHLTRSLSWLTGRAPFAMMRR